MSENATNSVSTTAKSFLRKLSRGDFGLAKTYWIYGVIVGFILNIAMKPITSIGLLAVIMLVYTAYEILVLMGTWRAADKYEGSKIWAVLAKIAVILGAIMLAVGLIAIVVLLSHA